MEGDETRKISAAEQKAQALFHSVTRAKVFYQNQMVGELNQEMQDFIQRQDMVFIATSDKQGNPDCSFRAGPPGFLKVLDEKRLCFPEYRGNGVMASVGNILDNPKIGMVFFDFYESTVGLHVNGHAQIVKNSEMQTLGQTYQGIFEGNKKVGERHAECWVLIEVEEAYIHCSKHIPLLKKMPKSRHWGTDEERYKGGDFFHVQDGKSNRKEG